MTLNRFLDPSLPELVFEAKMESDDPNNADRTFIIRFSQDDDEIKIWENPSDGYNGGFFYVSPRGRPKKPADPSLPYLGNSITVNGVTFILTEASDSTFNAMEARSDVYPFSDLSTVVQEINKAINKTDLESKFKELDTEKTERIPLEMAKKALEELLPAFNRHQIATILRRYRYYMTNLFAYGEFLLDV